MVKIKIISDTAHNLPEEVSRNIPMIEIPFEIIVGEDCFKDNNLTLAELAELLERRKGQYPTTSAPSQGDFSEAYKAAKSSDGILVVTIGAGYSATYNNAVQATRLFRESVNSDTPIEVVDSRGGTMSQGFLLMEAHSLISEGGKLDEVATSLRIQAERNNLVFALRETTYLYRSGRAKGVQHLLSSILRIKPVLATSDGTLKLLDRVRGDIRKALKRVAEEVRARSGGKIDKLAIIGGLGTEESEEFLEHEIYRILPRLPKQVIHAKMCPTIMVHVDPHGVGAAWV